VLKITSVLKHEQLRRGYVGAETELILNLREQYIQKGSSCKLVD
jgi:hypothetical protein